MRKNIAIILAAGTGSRLNYNKPKQFVKIAGKLIIEHTTYIFQKHDLIDEIAIISHADFIETVEKLVIENEFTKVKKILVGGKERYHSSLVAIEAYFKKQEECNLIFHDGVRPLVSNKIINDTIKALKKYNAVDVAIPATDTIIKVKDNLIECIPDRKFLMRGQTPQAFKLSVIKKAYDLALKNKFINFSDDCGVIKKYLPEEPIFVVNGDESNMKLTYEEDLFLIDKLFQLKSIDSISLFHKGFSILKNKVLVIFGGSSGIGKDIANISKEFGVKTYCFSRNLNNTDISNVSNVKKALLKVFKKEKKIDYVVNTAAVLSRQPLIHKDYKLIFQEIRINYTGNIIVAKESFEYLKKSKGKLLLFTSSSYTRGRAMYSIYSSLKAATVNLVQALSSEWDSFGIKINCINPERTLTPMRIKNFGKEDINTLLSSKKVAEESIKVLLSDINGQIIDVKINK